MIGIFPVRFLANVQIRNVLELCRSFVCDFAVDRWVDHSVARDLVRGKG